MRSSSSAHPGVGRGGSNLSKVSQAATSPRPPLGTSPRGCGDTLRSASYSLDTPETPSRVVLLEAPTTSSRFMADIYKIAHS